jgi:L-2-hydroxycarboxylate dehydrogenase (NAD+)
LGVERIYIHGEKEFEQAEQFAKEGVPLNAKVAKDLRAIAEQLGMHRPF